MRTRFSVDELTKFERLTDEIKTAARDIARKFHPTIPLYEPWVFDLYVGDSYVTIKWCERCGCDDEEADEVTQYDIRALHVDDSHTTIDIVWREVFDSGETCQSTFERVETVPAEWFALDEGNLRNVVKSYKKQMKELIEGLKKDLETAEENRRDADNRIAEIKRQLSNLEGY